MHSRVYSSTVLVFLAPTGALIVIVCYYWSAGNFFRFFSIYANIFSFFFLRIECRLIIIDLEDHDDYNEHDDPDDPDDPEDPDDPAGSG